MGRRFDGFAFFECSFRWIAIGDRKNRGASKCVSLCNVDILCNSFKMAAFIKFGLVCVVGELGRPSDAVRTGCIWSEMVDFLFVILIRIL